MLKSQQLKTHSSLDSFLNFFSDNYFYIGVAAGISLLTFGGYVLYKNYIVMSDENLIESYKNKYQSLETLAFMELHEIDLSSILNSQTFYSFCLNFFNNYSNLNTFLDNVTISNKNSFIEFVHFCQSNPTHAQFKNYNISKKVLLDFSQELYNYIRSLSGLKQIFFT